MGAPHPHTLEITNAASGTPNPVASGGAVNVIVSAKGSFSHSLSYAWTASCPGLVTNASFSNAASRTPTWTAPANTTGSQQSCTLSVGVNDGAGGLTRTSAYQQGINSDRQPPTAVRVMAPTSGQRIAGIFALKGTAQDNSGTVQILEFYIDADSTPACADNTPQTLGSHLSVQLG